MPHRDSWLLPVSLEIVCPIRNPSHARSGGCRHRGPGTAAPAAWLGDNIYLPCWGRPPQCPSLQSLARSASGPLVPPLLALLHPYCLVWGACSRGKLAYLGILADEAHGVPWKPKLLLLLRHKIRVQQALGGSSAADPPGSQHLVLAAGETRPC